MSQHNFNNKLPPEVVEALAFKDPDFSGFEQIPVRGYDFETCNTSDGKIDFDKMLSDCSFSMGLQSSTFARAVEQINKMIDCKLFTNMTDEDLQKQRSIPLTRQPTACTIFLSYTSNLVTSGLREVIRYLVKNNMVDCLVTTAGGIEEDFMKCLAPTVVGSFNINAHDLFERSVYRAGNMLIPCKNYSLLEDWIVPILDQMLAEEIESGQVWTPSRMIHRLGKEINNEESIYYWAYKNNIPVFSPAITDGAIGDNLFMHSFKHGRTITVDIAQDIRHIMFQAMRAVNSGVIILGGGLSKHHILNANSMRGGADYAVYINTASEFDGCDSGALPGNIQFLFQLYCDNSTKRLEQFTSDELSSGVQVSRQLRLLTQKKSCISTDEKPEEGNHRKHNCRRFHHCSVFYSKRDEFEYEAFTWGKISLDATPVKLFAEASLVLPLIVSQTFFKKEKFFKEGTQQMNGCEESS